MFRVPWILVYNYLHLLDLLLWFTLMLIGLVALLLTDLHHGIVYSLTTIFRQGLLKDRTLSHVLVLKLNVGTQSPSRTIYTTTDCYSCILW